VPELLPQRYSLAAASAHALRRNLDRPLARASSCSSNLAAKVEPVDMKLEVVVLGVSDVDRAKAFYENLGWRLDTDIAAGNFRGVQMTPHNSGASIIFGKGITSAKPGSSQSLVLEVSEVFHYAGGTFSTVL
jgi:bleomycin resistance family protein